MSDSLGVGMQQRLLLAIAALEARVAVLEAASQVVPGGKHAGRQRAWVVAKDPYHVIWLSQNPDSTSHGYTKEHLQEARRLTTGARPDTSSPFTL